MVRNAHRSKWPNSLKTVASGVTNCCNLHFGGRVTWGLTGVPYKGGRRTELPPMFIQGKRRKKPERCGLRTLIVNGSGVVFMHGGGISTLRVRHKGWQPLIKCAISCLQFFLFSFFIFLCFLWAFCIFYLFAVDKGVSLAPTYPQLRCGNQTYVVLSELNVG